MKGETNRKGFTLTELLVVAAVIGILAAIALPTYSGHMAKGKAGVIPATSPMPNAVAAYYTKAADDATAIRAAYRVVDAPTEYAAVSVDDTGAITVRRGAVAGIAQAVDKADVEASLRLHGRNLQYLYELIF